MWTMHDISIFQKTIFPLMIKLSIKMYVSLLATETFAMNSWTFHTCK